MDNTNCRNCGAPTKNGRCEYCGTEKPRRIESGIYINADGIRFGTVIVGNKNKVRL